jgi:hypothetical protein
MFLKDPIAGTNVTFTNKWALGAESLKVTGSATFAGSLSIPDGSSSTPSIFFTTATGLGFYRISSDQIGLATTAANRSFILIQGGVSRCEMGSVAFSIVSGGLFRWSSNSGGPSDTSIDTALGRNGAGVVEINSGAAGTFRDLKLRNLLVQAGGLLSMTSTGGAAVIGNSTLVGGTVTVNTTAAVTGTKIFLQRKAPGGTIGMSLTYTISSGTSFTINSDNPLDTSTVDWHIIGVL